MLVFGDLSTVGCLEGVLSRGLGQISDPSLRESKLGLFKILVLSE